MKIRYDKRALQRMRAERGLTLDQLARVCRVTDRAILNIERGYADPKASTLAKLARGLGVSVEAFFVRKDTAA